MASFFVTDQILVVRDDDEAACLFSQRKPKPPIDRRVVPATVSFLHVCRALQKASFVDNDVEFTWNRALLLGRQA